VKIADDLMKDGRYADAWPYAEAAARTWAGWAMTCAQNCAEGLEKWDAAEGYARASSQRYPGSMWAVWFLFCEQTGHGDIAAARAWTKRFSAELLESPDLSTDWSRTDRIPTFGGESSVFRSCASSFGMIRAARQAPSRSDPGRLSRQARRLA
jgi:hypothetical protein